MSQHDLPDPPQIPQPPRHVRLYVFQWIGLVALSVLPVLAITGVFGERWDTAHATTPTLDVAVTFPSRFRYKQVNQIELWLKNTGPENIDTITVALDTAFARQFSTINAIPPLEDAFSLSLTDVRPGSDHLVIIELQAERYGAHRGVIRVMGADSTEIPLHVRVFP